MKLTSLILLVSFFVSSSIFADSDEEERRRILEEYGTAEQSQQHNQQNIQKNSKTNVTDDELEESIRKTVQDLQVISPTEGSSLNNSKSKGDKYRSRELKESYLTGAMDGVMKSMLKEFLKENPFSKMSEPQVRNLIEGRVNSTPAGNFFQNNPRAMDFLVKWLRDKRALPRFFAIANEPDKLRTFGIIAFCIFILSFILNLFNSKGNLFKRIFKKLMIVIGVTALNITVFYIMFKANVQPSVDLLMQHLNT